MSDPSSRRATRLARLVIATVALPSLLLTALGVVAVSNEEAAARKRLEKLYTPLGGELADRFNAWMAQRLEKDGPFLEALARWADHPEGPLDPELEAFLAEADYATNFFVIDPAVGRRLPATSAPAGSKLTVAAEAATSFTEVPNCAIARHQRASTETSSSDFCPLALAVALCTRDESDRSTLDETCPAYARHPAAGSLLGLLEAGGRMSEAEFVDAARAIAAELEDPTRASPRWLVPLVARRASALLHDLEGRGARVRRRLQLLATREGLVRALEGRNRNFQAMEMTSEAIAVEDWRRVIISRTVGDRLVGYELVPGAVAEALEGPKGREPLAKTIRLVFHPISAPHWWWGQDPGDKKKVADDVVWWALLKRTDLAWSIALELSGEQSFWSLSRSRSGLYLWALVLIATALVGGIGFTLRAVAREGRLSRLKTDFVSSVSHDLRTPLTSIRMFTETLLMGRVSNPEQQRQYLEVIAEEAERLSRLTERILDFSRMEAGRKAYAYQEEAVRPLVEQTLRSCGSMLEEYGGTVTLDIPDELPDVDGDRDALVEMLINLVTNAIKYSEDPPNITLRVRPDGPWIAIEVEDQGIGISSADQRRIFEKFHRVDCRRTSEVGGCGIGLSLVQHIVESHGGQVDVRSILGRGSTFTVRIPVAGQRGALAMRRSTSRADSANIEA